MMIKLLFKNLELWLWVIYAAPSDASILEDTFKVISTEARKDTPNRRIQLITGDWNKTFDSFLDRSPPNNQNNKDIFTPRAPNESSRVELSYKRIESS